MSTEATLLERCESKCELCSAESPLTPFVVAPHTQITVDHAVMLCDTCKGQIEDPDTVDANHWRCLNDSMWSQVTPVQVLAWRQLKRLATSEGWAQDLVEMMYMDEETQKWAEIGMDDDAEKPLDVNGVELKKGDDVTVIKDLPVKGSSMVIKQGTA
ncbi:PhnA domain-containing protein, partial [Vibrio cholerae]